jgi:N-methylhydantoinase B
VSDESSREEAPGHAGGDLDPVTRSVIRNAAVAAAEEMTATLVRTAHSPNITEREDCSCALFQAAGDLVAQGETIPVHLGAMPFSVAAATEAFPPDDLAPGDTIALNDPFDGGAHLPDITLVSPVFATSGHSDEDLVGYVANRAHHADVGGATAGSVGAESTEIYQEGVRIPPIKLIEGGAINEAAMELFLANVRTPEERRGDLRAQIAANHTGRERFRELLGEHGTDTALAGLEAAVAYADRRMRSAIGELADGTYTFADALDDDGQGFRDVPIEARVTVDGESIHVDFSGSASQTTGPINAPMAVTASATYYVCRAITDPDIPANAGCYRAIEIDAPAGTVVNATPPAAVVGGNLETSQRIVDVLLGALAPVAPDRVVAGCQGTMNNLTVGGTDPRDGSPYAFYETQGGGFGGRAGADGMDGVHAHMSNTQNTPIEVLETAYPLRVERYSLRPNTGGVGEYRGGLGLRRDLTALGECTVSLLADRHRHPPYGLFGGGDGAPGEHRLIDPSGEASPLPAKTTLTLSAGETISLRTPGGGGYGDPADRDDESIRRDRRTGKITGWPSDADTGEGDPPPDGGTT